MKSVLFISLEWNLFEISILYKLRIHITAFINEYNASLYTILTSERTFSMEYFSMSGVGAYMCLSAKFILLRIKIFKPLSKNVVVWRRSLVVMSGESPCQAPRPYFIEEHTWQRLFSATLDKNQLSPNLFKNNLVNRLLHAHARRLYFCAGYKLIHCLVC